MTKGKQWQRMDLALDDIRERKGFQWRTQGLNAQNVGAIMRTLAAGEDARDPVKVAKIGKVQYLLDGFHRLEAYRNAGRRTIPAEVAKMSLSEAAEYAKASNALNGKPYNRADKERLWGVFLAEGRHRDEYGELKPSRTIAKELQGRFYSHETVRKKLKALGYELDEETEYPEGFSPMLSEEGLQEDLCAVAAEGLRTFGRTISDLSPHDRDRLLQAAQGIIEAAVAGERVDLTVLLPDDGDLLDI